MGIDSKSRELEHVYREISSLHLRQGILEKNIDESRQILTPIVTRIYLTKVRKLELRFKNYATISETTLRVQCDCELYSYYST